VRREDVKKHFYNHEAQGNISRLRQTNLKRYLLAVWNSTFISPITIPARPLGEPPTVHYGIAMHPEGDYYCLLFTRLREFNEWNKKVNGVYLPHETTITEYRSVTGKHPILINPESERILLTPQLIKQLGVK
jgi:hypothetical protein